MGFLKRLFLVAGLVVIGMLALSGGLSFQKISDGSIASLSGLDSVVAIKDQLLGAVESESRSNDEPINAFKWQDEDGVWHFGDKAPEDSVAETVVIRQVQTMELPAPVLPKQAQEAGSELPNGPVEYIDRSRKLLDEAKNVEAMLQEQDDQRRKALENL